MGTADSAIKGSRISPGAGPSRRMINGDSIEGSMPPRRVTIVGLGDSTTAGTPAFLSPLEAPPNGEGNSESQYAHWMERAHAEWIVLNRGINGQTAGEIRARFERDVVRAKPAYVIILAGVNDIFGGGSAEAVERELAAMYADALDSAIVPVAASVLPYDQATPRATAAIFTLNTWIESFAKVLDIPFADTHAAVAAANAPHRLRGSPDGLHPDVDGYRRMGDVLARTIEVHLARLASQ